MNDMSHEKKERGRVHIAIPKLAKPSHQGGRYIQSRKLRLTKQRIDTTENARAASYYFPTTYNGGGKS